MINPHIAWVAEALRRMQSIKAGMTRADLLHVFQGAGGAHAVPPEVFSYRDCPLFKVAVTFEGKSGRPKFTPGQSPSLRSPEDVIASITKPYLEQVYYD